MQPNTQCTAIVVMCQMGLEDLVGFICCKGIEIFFSAIPIFGIPIFLSYACHGIPVPALTVTVADQIHFDYESCTDLNVSLIDTCIDANSKNWS